VVALVLALGLVVGGSIPALAAPPTQAERVVRAVSSHIGARYVAGATGPRTFDCSGLVYRAFRDVNLARRIGGELTASGYYQRFRRLGRLSRVAPRAGDLVVYAQGGHVGIYVGRGMVVSALVSGVKRHPIRGLNIPFTGILRVELTRQRPRPARTRRPVLRIVIADRRLPVRANPGPDSRALGVIRRGDRVGVRGSRTRWGTTWLRVRLADGRYGWVRETLTSAP
jgi:cell wall-associated NlpC family hydrolase